MKKIILYGKNSYIGNHVKIALIEHGMYVEEVDSKTVLPANIDFSGVDVVINVAGIAHVKIDSSMEAIFYKINRDLAIELSHYAKEAGVKQYIYMSSMNVYGDTKEKICSISQENPKNFYGKSKLEADSALRSMSSEDYKVVCVRPPVVYGKGCKGNFQLLVKMARYMPIFPKFYNTKSMIYIEHLCEFIHQCVVNEESGIFHPQNVEYTSTVAMICAIRKTLKKRTILIPGVNWIIKILSRYVSKIDRAFSDDYYDLEFSYYRDNSYCKFEFMETIEKTISGD